MTAALSFLVYGYEGSCYGNGVDPPGSINDRPVNYRTASMRRVGTRCSRSEHG